MQGYFRGCNGSSPGENFLQGMKKYCTPCKGISAGAISLQGNLQTVRINVGRR
jgi:hypothetical protein